MHIARIALQHRIYIALYIYIDTSLSLSLPFSLYFLLLLFYITYSRYNCICGRGILNYLNLIVKTSWTLL